MIDFVFLTVDLLGAFFSLMSLVAQNIFDYLGGMLYIVCITLEIGIFVSHGIWLLRTRNQRKHQKEESEKEKDNLEADSRRCAGE
jgi:hypothetical protein